MQDSGILEPDTLPRDGIFNSQHAPKDHMGSGSPDIGSRPELLAKIAGAHSMPEYLAFFKNAQLRGFVKSFTGIHYDQIFLRGGNPRDEFLTAWVPLGDVAADGLEGENGWLLTMRLGMLSFTILI